MFLQAIELTTALRPELLPDETLLFVQDFVGLYEGKFKVPRYQNGHAYLTSHRICYVDNPNPRQNSTSIDLRNISRYEFYAGFLKSSPKITLHLHPPKNLSLQSQILLDASSLQRFADNSVHRASEPPLAKVTSANRVLSGSGARVRIQNTTWVCRICSLSNPLPPNFEAATASSRTSLPPCLACGIKPSLAHLLKAAMSTNFGRNSPIPNMTTSIQPQLESHQQNNGEVTADYLASSDMLPNGPEPPSSFRCPRCTFQNHSSLLSCELCGASLLMTETYSTFARHQETGRSESPGSSLDGVDTPTDNAPEYIKISFRGGGDRIFHERLKGAMIQRKWLLQNAPPVPQPIYPRDGSPGAFANLHVGLGGHVVDDRPKAVGIAGLERRGLDVRKNNETVIGNAFEDLEALMASAKEIIALAESFASSSTNNTAEANEILKKSAAALGMVTTKAMLASSSGSDALYISELSRTLAEFLTDDRQGVLRREGGIMRLVDLWAVFNRARNGVELVHPAEFEKAARLWEKLGLPVRLRQFRNGLLVVQRHDWTDDKCITRLLVWLREPKHLRGVDDGVVDRSSFGKGVTVQEAAAYFGWSVGVASEELEMAEEKEALCREEGVEGLRFWENWLVAENGDGARGTG